MPNIDQNRILVAFGGADRRPRPAMIPRAAALALVLAGGGGCAAIGGAAPGPPPPGPPWLSATERDHPLAGRIWRPALERFVTAGEVIAAAGEVDFVLIGEKHDNADHHRIQSWILERLIAGGSRPAVAFEMLVPDQEERLNRHLAAHPADAAGLGPAVGWSESGWPDWVLYQPIFEAAVRGSAPMLAAGLARATLRDIGRGGVEALGDERAAALGLGQELPPEMTAALSREIVEAHCNQLPEAMVGPMIAVTRAKDAQMAASLLRGARLPGRDGAVLIAGNGHVRADRGVPWHLARLAPGKSILAIGMLEVQPEATRPGDYGEVFDADPPPFDLLWFTPRVDLIDPCEAFAEQLERARQRHEKEQSE